MSKIVAVKEVRTVLKVGHPTTHTKRAVLVRIDRYVLKATKGWRDAGSYKGVQDVRQSNGDFPGRITQRRIK